MVPHLPTLRGIIALIDTAQHFCLSAKQDPHMSPRFSPSPLQHKTQLKGRHIFGEQWLFTCILHHQIAQKISEREGMKKKKRETKMSLLKCQSYVDKNLRMQGGLW